MYLQHYSLLVALIKVISAWRIALLLVVTAGVASLITNTVSDDSESFQRDLIAAISQQKECVVVGNGVDGQDGKDGADGKDGTDGQD